MPFTFLPYMILFLTTPNMWHIFSSVSAMSSNGSSSFSLKSSCDFMLSRETPNTVAPAFTKSLYLSRNCMASVDRKSTRLNSSHLVISYAVFCLKKKKKHYYIAQLGSLGALCHRVRSYREAGCIYRQCDSLAHLIVLVPLFLWLYAILSRDDVPC